MIKNFVLCFINRSFSFGDTEALGKFEEAASVEQNNFDPFASGIAAEMVFKP